MHRYHVFRIDADRGLGGLFGAHGIKAVDWQEGIVDTLILERIHLLDVVGVPSVVELNPIEGEDVTDAFILVMMRVVGGDRLDVDATLIELAVDTAI